MLKAMATAAIRRTVPMKNSRAMKTVSMIVSSNRNRARKPSPTRSPGESCPSSSFQLGSQGECRTRLRQIDVLAARTLRLPWLQSGSASDAIHSQLTPHYCILGHYTAKSPRGGGLVTTLLFITANDIFFEEPPLFFSNPKSQGTAARLPSGRHKLQVDQCRLNRRMPSQRDR